MVYTLYTDIYLYILVYQNNIGYIQAYTVTCDYYIFHAEAYFMMFVHHVIPIPSMA